MESNIYPNETNNIDLSNQTLSSKLTIYTWSHSSEFPETRSIARDNTKHSATSSEGGRLEFLRPKLLYEALRGCWRGFVPWVPHQMDSERRNRGPPWVCPLSQKIWATTWQTNATSVVQCYGREYMWLKDLSSMYYGRELSHICGCMRELDFTFYENEILHFYGYWKMILFLRLRETPILVDHETGCMERLSPYHSMHIKNVQIHVICINLNTSWSWTPN
jgi:hypothetical protein